MEIVAFIFIILLVEFYLFGIFTVMCHMCEYIWICLDFGFGTNDI